MKTKLKGYIGNHEELETFNKHILTDISKKLYPYHKGPQGYMNVEQAVEITINVQKIDEGDK